MMDCVCKGQRIAVCMDSNMQSKKENLLKTKRRKKAGTGCVYIPYIATTATS